MEKKILSIIVFIISLVSMIAFSSCNRINDINSFYEDNDIKSFYDKYEIETTFTHKPEKNSFIYYYVYNCKVKITPKTEANKNYNVKVSIYDGAELDNSEEIITVYYKLNDGTIINDEIDNIYTYGELSEKSVKVTVVDIIGKSYTKDFFDIEKVYYDANGGYFVIYDRTTHREPIYKRLFSYRFIEQEATPFRTGYSFDGWYFDKECTKKVDGYKGFKDGIKLYAKWSKKEYSIRYFVESDVLNPNIITTYDIETDDIELLNPERAGYTFCGWYDNSKFEGKSIKSIKKGSFLSINLYPKWEANVYDVELIYNDGVTGNEVVKEIFGSAYVNLPIPTREGYIFEGWYLDETGYENYACSFIDGFNNPKKVSVPSNHKLYARWVQGTNGLIYTKTTDGLNVKGCNGEFTNIVIPEEICGVNIVSIGQRAFYKMSKLTEISIPSGVTSIASYSFDGCSSIVSVYYDGSIESWNKIVIDESNDELTCANIIYYDLIN